MNGLALRLKEANKTYLDEKEHSGCDHYTWKGGKKVLIDTLNNVWVEDFRSDKLLNFYSLNKTKEPNADSTWYSVLAKDGQYYSFIDYEKEYQQWLTATLKNDFSPESIMAISHDNLVWVSANN